MGLTKASIRLNLNPDKSLYNEIYGRSMAEVMYAVSLIP